MLWLQVLWPPVVLGRIMAPPASPIFFSLSPTHAKDTMTMEAAALRFGRPPLPQPTLGLAPYSMARRTEGIDGRLGPGPRW